MSKFSKRRVEYERLTKFGRDFTKQKEWEMMINRELIELDEYSYQIK